MTTRTERELSTCGSAETESQSTPEDRPCDLIVSVTPIFSRSSADSYSLMGSSQAKRPVGQPAYPSPVPTFAFHSDAEEVAESYLTGRLAADAVEPYEAHLTACRGCRARVEEVREFVDAMCAAAKSFRTLA
jgi:hypothetical protein